MGRFSWAVALAGVAACGNGGDGGGGGNGGVTLGLDQIYSPQVNRLAVEFDFEAGAEPYSGTLAGLDVVDLFRQNVERLFRGSGKIIEIPETLNGMGAIPDAGGPDFTAERILQLAGETQDIPSTSDTASFHFLFLDGYLFNDGERQASVLGASIGNTRVIAMFKPVIAGSSSFPIVQRYVEQSTLIHEFGHAVGLVANGVPAIAAHHDEAHGPHCLNPRCVMYFSNEGAADAARFVQDVAMGGDTVLYDDDCLDDVAARLRAGGLLP